MDLKHPAWLRIGIHITIWTHLRVQRFPINVIDIIFIPHQHLDANNLGISIASETLFLRMQFRNDFHWHPSSIP
jgi:hypothetical protein